MNLTQSEDEMRAAITSIIHDGGSICHPAEEVEVTAAIEAPKSIYRSVF